MIRMIKLIYNDYKGRVEHKGKYTVPLNIESGVKPGSVMSPTLFLIIDWIMKKVTDNRTGISWKLQNKLEDIEFADDVCLLTEKRNHMQRKLQQLETETRKAELKINVNKTKTLRNRNEQISQIKLGNVDIEEDQRVNYLGAVIERNGGSKADVLTRISKAQQAFNQLGGIWKINVVSTGTKVKIFNCTMKSVLQ
jgi:hypothetical protein